MGWPLWKVVMFLNFLKVCESIAHIAEHRVEWAGGVFNDFLNSPLGKWNPIWRSYFSTGWFNHQLDGFVGFYMFLFLRTKTLSRRGSVFFFFGISQWNIPQDVDDSSHIFVASKTEFMSKYPSRWYSVPETNIFSRKFQWLGLPPVKFNSKRSEKLPKANWKPDRKLQSQHFSGENSPWNFRGVDDYWSFFKSDLRRPKTPKKVVVWKGHLGNPLVIQGNLGWLPTTWVWGTRHVESDSSAWEVKYYDSIWPGWFISWECFNSTEGRSCPTARWCGGILAQRTVGGHKEGCPTVSGHMILRLVSRWICLFKVIFLLILPS